MYGDLINKIIQAFRNLFNGDGTSREPLDPSELKRKLLETAQAEAKHWDDQVDLPNTFDVYLSQQEWDTYFGIKPEQTKSRLESALVQFANESGAAMERPKVTLLVDDNLFGSNVSIDAFFTTPDDLDDDHDTSTGTSFGQTSGTTGAGADWTTTPVFESPSDRRAEFPTNASVTPTLQPEIIAFVSSPDGGRRFDVHDNDTIGLLRDTSREMPKIQLPFSRSLEYCAQIQGMFKLDGNEWSIVNRGRNGTHVQRGNEWIQPDGEAFRLKDGDTIYFGDPSSPAVVFHTDSMGS